MHTQQFSCDDRQLQQMLDSKAGADQFEPLLQHIEGCLRCQTRLDQLAADRQQWTQAAQILSGYSSQSSFRSVDFAGHSLTNETQPIAWTESMARQLLSPASHPEMLGRIGRYEVERLIGSGGMGIVFKAIDTELNRPVAIKILAPYLAGNGAARQRFAREAKAAAAVVHEHVVPIHNVETDGSSPFLVMRYVSGESLQSRLDREGPQAVEHILRIGLQVAAGLAAAHAHGLVHRDIKPSNILVESGVDRSLITDFGLARAADDASLTNTGYHPGTPQFMSPEQARGDAMDRRSDLFSLGSVLYTMCTGRPPFRAETSYGVLRRITDSQPRDIQEINAQIPTWLTALIAKLMSKDPSDRIQSAEHLSQLMAECLSHWQQPKANPLPDEVAKLLSRKSTENTLSKVRRLRGWLAIPAVALTIGLFTLWPDKKMDSGDRSSSQTSTTNQSSQLEPRDLPNTIDGPVANQSSNKSSNRNIESRKPRYNRPESEADKLRAQLSQSIELILDDQPLEVAVGKISEILGVTLRINIASFAEDADVHNKTISLIAHGPATSVLDRLCDLSQSAYIVHDSSIEITSKSYAQNHPVIRYYDLSYVVPDSSYVAALESAVMTCTNVDRWSSNHGPYSVTTVDSWMIIRATEQVHHQIEQLLYQLVLTQLTNNPLQTGVSQ